MSGAGSAATPAPWWRHAVIYQVYVRSFADAYPAAGDGVGDLPGITARLPYLRDLGVDALWVTPFYTSPQKDHGYDVADYLGVDPLFGDLEAADTLLATAHDLGLRVIVDLVPNHTSSAHPWFQAALAAGPGSPERARYLFREGHGVDGDEPPNNWRSIFGGSAWTRVDDEQAGSAAGGTARQLAAPSAPETRPAKSEWYLHLFDPTQPDLDWRNPEVGDEFERVLRFWLDRGVDGFRVDVAHGLYKEESLRDQVRPEPDEEPEPHTATQPPPPDADDGTEQSMVQRVLADEPMWDQPEVHEVYRRWRRILEEYDGDRIAVAEAWTQTAESMARFVRDDELHQTFNFAWLLTPWSAKEFAQVINRSIAALAEVSAPPTWVLSNHDVTRHPTRYGGGPVGVARGRAATLLMLALPGSAYLYQGEELGLEQVDVPSEARQDPSWFRTGKPGRDGCRVPLPWSGSAPPYGFSHRDEQPWIPQPEDWAGLTVEAQLHDDGSTLAFYRRALAARRELLRDLPEATVAEVEGDLLVVRRGDLVALLNAGDDPVRLPAGEVLLASDDVDDELPPDTSVWLRVQPS